MNYTIFQWVGKHRLRFSRGKGWYYEVKDLVVMTMALKVFNAPVWMYPVVVVTFLVSMYTLGWLDEMKAKIWQEEQRYSSKVVNPVQKEILAAVRIIKRNTTPKGLRKH